MYRNTFLLFCFIFFISCDRGDRDIYDREQLAKQELFYFLEEQEMKTELFENSEGIYKGEVEFKKKKYDDFYFYSELIDGKDTVLFSVLLPRNFWAPAEISILKLGNDTSFKKRDEIWGKIHTW